MRTSLLVSRRRTSVACAAFLLTSFAGLSSLARASDTPLVPFLAIKSAVSSTEFNYTQAQNGTINPFTNDEYGFTSGYIYTSPSISFPAAETYTFDVSAYGVADASGNQAKMKVLVDGIEATADPSKTTTNAYTMTDLPVVYTYVMTNITAGAHEIRIRKTDVFTGSLYVALLYVSPGQRGNVYNAVKYPAPGRKSLTLAFDSNQTYKGRFLTADHFASGHLRGVHLGKGGSVATNPESDFVGFANLGANLHRYFLVLNEHGTAGSDQGYDYAAGSLDLDPINTFLTYAKRYGYYVNLVIQIQDKQSWQGNANNKSDILAKWTEIATKFKNEKVIACYSLLNEPKATGRQAELAQLFQDIAAAIRAVDSNHVLVVPYPLSPNFMKVTQPIPFGNVVYEYHSYQPFEITHQGVDSNQSTPTEYPNLSGVTSQTYYNSSLGDYDKTTLSGAIQFVRDFQARSNAPMYMGEFSCIDWAPTTKVGGNWPLRNGKFMFSHGRYIEDSASLFDDQLWAWTYFAWRSYEGWWPDIWSCNYYTDPSITWSAAKPSIANGNFSAWATSTGLAAPSGQTNPTDAVAMLTSRFQKNLEFPSHGDVGAPGVPGTTVVVKNASPYNAPTGAWSISGAGTDIFGSADQFQFAHESWTGDGRIIARVASITNTHIYAKAGVMFREGTSAGARHVLNCLVANPGVQMLHRGTTNGTTTSDVLTLGTTYQAPYWLRLDRRYDAASNTDIYTGYQSLDGKVWFQTANIALAPFTTVEAGLAVTSHNAASANTSVFDNIAVSSLPTWASVDVAATASGTVDSIDAAGVFHVSGNGTGIDATGSAADSFHYNYQIWNGDGTFITEVATIGTTNSGAEAGIMFRKSLDPGAANVAITVTPGTSGTNGKVQFRRRAQDGSSTTATNTDTTIHAGCYIKLVRVGDTFTAYASQNLASWTQIGNPVTVALGAGGVCAGIVVASHSTALNSSTFDSVYLTPDTN